MTVKAQPQMVDVVQGSPGIRPHQFLLKLTHLSLKILDFRTIRATLAQLLDLLVQATFKFLNASQMP